MAKEKPTPVDAEVDESRRAFLERVSKYAAVTPPAITLLLAAGCHKDRAAQLYRQ